MKIIKGNSVDQALESSGRVYLCGNLEQPQAFEALHTGGYEIGISEYPDFICERPHQHLFNDEYNYVLEGELKIYLFDEKREYHLTRGDLFLIEPHMPYVGKAQAGTRVIFSKVPGGDDKELLPELNNIITNWSRSWDALI